MPILLPGICGQLGQGLSLAAGETLWTAAAPTLPCLSGFLRLPADIGTCPEMQPWAWREGERGCNGQRAEALQAGGEGMAGALCASRLTQP